MSMILISTNKLKKSFAARPAINLPRQSMTNKPAKQKRFCRVQHVANASFVKSARSKNAALAIVYITLPNNADWQAAVEKKTPTSFEIVIESVAGLKEPTADSNEKQAWAVCECEVDHAYSIRSC
jgi:hypothetical protein